MDCDLIVNRYSNYLALTNASDQNFGSNLACSGGIRAMCAVQNNGIYVACLDEVFLASGC